MAGLIQLKLFLVEAFQGKHLKQSAARTLRTLGQEALASCVYTFKTLFPESDKAPDEEGKMAVQALAKPEVSQAHSSRISTPEALCLGVILLLYFLAAMHAAQVRALWFDELSTLFMISPPTLRGMLQAIPTDGNPPLYFLLARLFLHLPIKTELALRVPAIIGYSVASLTVYRFVRRDVDRIFAFLSMSVLIGAPFHAFAIEARAYSLLLAFTGIAIVCWQAYCRSGKPMVLTGLSLSIAAAIFTHQYGALYAMLPIVVGEAVRGLRRHAVDLRVLGALAIPAPSLLLTYPVMLRAQKPLLAAIRACPVFFARPRFSDLKDYALTLPPFILLAVAITLIALILKLGLSRRRFENTSAAVPPEDLAVACTLALFIPIMLIATHFGTGFFQHRYGIGSALGISMLAGLLLGALPWRYASTAAWTGAAYSLSLGLLGIWMGGKPADILPWLDPVLQAGDPREQIVVASALEYPPMWWYGDTLRGRLHYLVDLPCAGQHSDLVPEYSLALEHDYTPMQMEDYQTFLQTHRHFLLYCYGETRLEWIRTRLQQEGWRLTLLASAKEKVHDPLRSDDRELFLVTR